MKKFATILIIFFIGTATALACSCRRTLIFRDVKRADLIFTGSVKDVERKYLVKTYEYESKITHDTTFYYEFEFKIIRSYKGDFKKNESVIIKSTGGGADCGLYFEKATKYLVYTAETNYHFDPMVDEKIESYFYGSYCSRTKKSRRTWLHEWIYLLGTKLF